MTDAAAPDGSLEPGSTLPMFPLGTVLLPTMWLPLRVFEPRYRQLADDVLTGDRRFGVVLIERGSEVGGGDVRTDVGCLAHIVRADPLGGGQWALMCTGGTRLKVDSWLDDAPYPRAVVDPWPDEADDDAAGDGAAGDPEGWGSVLERFAAIRSLMQRLEVPGMDEPIELDDDPAIAAYQVALASPLGPLDRHRLLCAPSGSDRVALLAEQLVDLEVLLQARLDGV